MFNACAVINLVVSAWQKGQITYLWLVVSHAIILIDLVAPLIYVTIIVYTATNHKLFFLVTEQMVDRDFIKPFIYSHPLIMTTCRSH